MFPEHVARHRAVLQQAQDTLGDRFDELAAETADNDFAHITSLAINALEQANGQD